MKRLNIIILVFLFPILTGFDLSRHSIPLEEILSGGPRKDGIPAILKPKFIDAEKANFLKSDLRR